MAERFLKVTVTRTQESEVYIRVDDQHPEHAGIFDGAKISEHAYGIVGDIAHDAALRMLCDSDWYFESPNAVEVKEMHTAGRPEALNYGFFDAAKDVMTTEPLAQRACRELRESLGFTAPAIEPSSPLQQLRDFVGVSR